VSPSRKDCSLDGNDRVKFLKQILERLGKRRKTILYTFPGLFQIDTLVLVDQDVASGEV
jgi:hypothetical protein